MTFGFPNSKKNMRKYDTLNLEMGFINPTVHYSVIALVKTATYFATYSYIAKGGIKIQEKSAIRHVH